MDNTGVLVYQWHTLTVNTMSNDILEIISGLGGHSCRIEVGDLFTSLNMNKNQYILLCSCLCQESILFYLV